MKFGDMVLKYPLQVGEPTTHRIPVGAKILSAQWQQPHGPMLWMQVSRAAAADENGEPDARTFMVIGTGPDQHPLDERFEFIDTFQSNGGMFVWHAFEIHPSDD